MTATALIEAPRSDDAPDARSRLSDLLDSGTPLAGLPPLLRVVPVAGPPVSAYVGFGAVLLFLLVPPLALLATLVAVALVMGVALVLLVGLLFAIVKALALLVQHLRRQRFSVTVPQVHRVKVRRV